MNTLGKVYIGQTKNYTKRLNLYRILHCKKQTKLYNSLKKYGFNNHEFEIVEEVEKNACDREIYWIDFYKCYWRDKNKGLNLTRGGKYAKMTDETKKKLSEAILGSKHYRAKKLYQYSIEGEFVKEWQCMKDIQRELGFNTTWLSKATKNNKMAYGYKWYYDKQ